MNKIRYLFDEHISFNLKKAVKKHDQDIIIQRIGDLGVPQLGTLDPALQSLFLIELTISLIFSKTHNIG